MNETSIIGSLNSKHKDVATALWQRRMIGFVDVVSSLKMKFSTMSVDNVVATLKSDIVATLREGSANVVTTLQSRYFTKWLTTSFFNDASTSSQLKFWYLKLLFADMDT